jgi:hypothetical protein
MDEKNGSRENAYRQYRRQLVSLLQASYEHFDRAILALSGGGLALSLAFVKDIVPLSKNECRAMLVISWCLFAASILCTLISFLMSQQAIHRQIEYADKYYGENKEEYLTRPNIFSSWVTGLNIASAVSFFFAVIATVIFAAISISLEVQK